MVFQDPMTSLNPVFTIGKQMGEVLVLRFGMDRKAARDRSIEMLAMVGIADPASRLGNYPHELSGGMKQRVMIAMALLCEPRLLIADEPTTALDVTIQAQILHLIRDLQKRTGAAVLFITHDMGVVAEMCDEVAVMYAGRVVEQANVFDIFQTQPPSLHQRAVAEPAAKGPGEESRAADDRGHRAFTSEPAAILPLRRPLLEAQAVERSDAGEMLERRPGFAAL